MPKSKYEYQLDMWKDWKKTQDDAKMEALLDSLSPLLKHNISRYSRYPIPYNVLLHKAMTESRNAMKDYDPEKSQLGTYLTTRLRSMDRFVKTYQNTSFLPEYLAQEYGRHDAATKKLEERLNRPPTIKELSGEMGIPAKHIERIEAAKAPLSLMGSEIAGGDLMPTMGARQQDVLEYLRAELKGNELKAFDMLSGMKGKQLQPQTVADKLNVDVGRIYSWRRRWSNLVREHAL